MIPLRRETPSRCPSPSGRSQNSRRSRSAPASRFSTLMRTLRSNWIMKMNKMIKGYKTMIQTCSRRNKMSRFWLILVCNRINRATISGPRWPQFIRSQVLMKKIRRLKWWKHRKTISKSRKISMTSIIMPTILVLGKETLKWLSRRFQTLQQSRRWTTPAKVQIATQQKRSKNSIWNQNSIPKSLKSSPRSLNRHSMNQVGRLDSLVPTTTTRITLRIRSIIHRINEWIR